MRRGPRVSGRRQPPGRVSGGMVRPAAESAISVRRRRSRVSGFLALTTHQIAARWYQGARARKKVQALPSARNVFSAAGGRRAGRFCSKL